MTSRVALVILLVFWGTLSALAAEIREFDLRTHERLGNELIRASQRSDRGATDPIRKHALETARAAVKNRLFEVRYDYVVLNDPDKSGFLVYALALADSRRVIQTGGHYRVTVSADGSRVERIDLFSGFIQLKNENGQKPDLITSTQFSSKLPAEAWLYTSYIYGVPVLLATKDKTFWIIESGKIRKDTADSKLKKK
jgi:hypothetical protein